MCSPSCASATISAAQALGFDHERLGVRQRETVDQRRLAGQLRHLRHEMPVVVFGDERRAAEAVARKNPHASMQQHEESERDFAGLEDEFARLEAHRPRKAPHALNLRRRQTRKHLMLPVFER